jgi:hypothetical protein
MTAVVAGPAEVDLWLYQGDDFALTLTVTNPDGSAANLTGATFLAQVRDINGVLLATFNPTVAANVVTLALPHAVTAGLPAAGLWDCQMTGSSGSVQTLAGGAVHRNGDVSR